MTTDRDARDRERFLRALEITANDPHAVEWIPSPFAAQLEALRRQHPDRVFSVEQDRSVAEQAGQLVSITVSEIDPGEMRSRALRWFRACRRRGFDLPFREPEPTPLCPSHMRELLRERTERGMAWIRENLVPRPAWAPPDPLRILEQLAADRAPGELTFQRFAGGMVGIALCVRGETVRGVLDLNLLSVAQREGGANIERAIRGKVARLEAQLSAGGPGPR